MRITEEEFKRAGQIEDGVEFSDADLILAIKVKKLTIAYLESRGEKWWLAARTLRVELYELEGFVEARKRG